MKKIFLFISVLIVSVSAFCQGNIYSFFEFDITEGDKERFINGYERDIEWHKSQMDEWNWIGWFVGNGERNGRFIDATPDHQWKDFDNWKIDSKENAKNNGIHWDKYMKNPTGSFKMILEEYSSFKPKWYTAQRLQVYHFYLQAGKVEDFQTFLSDYKPIMQKVLGDEISFVWMKTISGEDTFKYYLLIGIENSQAFEHLKNLFQFNSEMLELKSRFSASVERSNTEIWYYMPQLSLLNE